MLIIDGLPHTPYFVFIKGLIDKSDKEILELLELGNNREVALRGDFNDRNCIYLSRDKNWVHIMDNYCYTHRGSQKFSNRVDELGKQYELFTCTVGDSDCSFDFRYFRGGKKIREYIVASPNYNDEVLMVDYGVPLPGESEGLKKADQFERVTYIAGALGIEIAAELKKIRCYEIGAEYYSA